MPSESGHSWQPIDLVALADAPAVRPTLARILYPGKRHVFAGESEAAKTLYAFALGLDVVRAGGRVLHLDFEMFAASTRERLREMGATDSELAAWIHVEPEGPPSGRDLDELLEMNPTLAIVDAAAGAYDSLGLDDNKRADVERFARAIVTPLTQAGVASIVIDHVTKNAETRGRYAIGSERKLGGSDVQLNFEPVHALHRGGTGLVKITVRKDRFGYLPRPLGELHLTSDPDTHAITWELREASGEAEPAAGDTFRPTVLMQRASRALAAAGEPISRTALADRFAGKREYKFRAIDCLIADGYAREDGRRVTFLTPFTEEVPGSQESSRNRSHPTSSPVPTPYKGEPEPGTTTKQGTIA